MKYLLWTGICCAAAMLSACSDDTGFNATDTGSLRLNLDVDRNVLSAQPSRSSLDDICANLSTSDFTIRLAKTDGSGVKEWPFDSFNGSDIAIGSYTVSASAGTEGKEGFDAAYFYGEESVMVKTDQTSSVSITARLANSAVRVNYTDAFRAYMDSYTASVRTAGSTEGIDYPAASAPDDDLFINPGDASLYVTFTTVQGQSATLKAAEFTAAAQHRYTVTVDINNGQMGDAILNVTFDDETVAEVREFTLSDELFNAPAPVVTPAEQNVTCIEGSRPADGAAINVIAAGGLGSVTLVTDCPYLVNRGWPAELDLFAAGTEMQDLLRNNGLNVRGLWNNPDKLAVIDLADVLAKIPVDGDQPIEVSFRVEAEDAFGKVSDPAAVLKATIYPLEFEVVGQELCLAGATEATLNVAFNGENLENAKVEVSDKGSGMWDEVSILSVARSRASAETPVYAVRISIPAGVGDVDARITPKGFDPIEYTITRSVPDFELAVADGDVFATHAYVTVKCAQVDPASLIAHMKVTATGASSLKVQHTEGATLLVSGLNPGAAVTLKATVVEKSANAAFTTESPLTVPNGDFENLENGVSVSGMPNGGEWSISSGINYQTSQNFTIQNPVGWATVNGKTANTSAKNQNSWFVVPSTLNTTMAWSVTVPKIKVIGIGGGTDTPAHFKNLTAQNGSNAMMLQNVGWSADGSTPGLWLKLGIGSDEYYCHNAPSNLDKSAGKLFLGSYAYSNGVETYNEGVAFASRPASLSGYYKFRRDAADSGELGTVTVTLLAGSEVIGQGTAQLQPADDFTQFNVPINYSKRAKATSLRIMFASSNHASYDQAVESANIKTTNYMSRYEMFSLGAALTVDNLSFNY